MLPRKCLCAALFLFAAASSVQTTERSPGAVRTIRIKLAVDEEFRRNSLYFLEIRRWATAASDFFERNFGLAFQVDDITSWSSDNSKRTFSGLFQDLYGKIEKGESDIVLGFTGQIRSENEVSGVASYPHGYALVKRMKHEYLTRVTVIHELCHLFGAVDLKKERSIMNKDEPRLEFDDFTRQIIRINIGRGFGPETLPLPPEEMSSAISLYQARKGLNRGEAGVPLMLAILYLETKDYEKAVQECLEAEKIAPLDTSIQKLLKMAQHRKER